MRYPITFVLAGLVLVGTMSGANAGEVRLGNHHLDVVTAGGIFDGSNPALGSSSNGNGLGSGRLGDGVLGTSKPDPDPTPIQQPGSNQPVPIAPGSTAIAPAPTLAGTGKLTGGSETDTSFVPGVGGSALARSFGSLDGEGVLTLQRVSTTVLVIGN